MTNGVDWDNHTNALWNSQTIDFSVGNTNSVDSKYRGVTSQGFINNHVEMFHLTEKQNSLHINTSFVLYEVLYNLCMVFGKTIKSVIYFDIINSQIV